MTDNAFFIFISFLSTAIIYSLLKQVEYWLLVFAVTMEIYLTEKTFWLIEINTHFEFFNNLILLVYFH